MNLEKLLVSDKSIVIYGAGIVATSVYTAIKTVYGRMPEYFMVSASEGNPSEIDGISVKTISQDDALNAEAYYLIAVPEAHHEAVIKMLCDYHVNKERLLLIDNQLENEIMELYYRSRSDFLTVREQITKRADDMRIDLNAEVYQAKCHVDKPLKATVVSEPYVVPIQVGVALTELSICKCRDDEGENISFKNPNYCELTATYYAWKNSSANYKGLCHYRRVFDLTENELGQVFSGVDSADVILPYPTIYYPSIEAEHSRYVKDSDWQAMCRALEEVASEYYTYYKNNFEMEQYFYNFNMLIAKKEVFDDYCGFLFSVLERTEQLTTPKGWERKDRFAGYLGENLTTLYFRKNRDKLKIAHVGKKWLV